MDGRRLRDVGEAGLLRELFPRLPAAAATRLGPGDDAAVVAAPDGRVVVTTDMLVEGRDFRRDWSRAYDVGWKAAMQNLADVAAMGAVPTCLVVGLAAPPDLEVAWALELADGLAAACSPSGAGVVGGDLSSALSVVVAVTALGDLEGREPVRRDGARPGDVVAVAGALGMSAAGLHLLRAGRRGVAPHLVERHRRPEPPLAAGPAAAAAGASALIDVSDGLVTDAGRVALASDVAVEIDDGWLASACAPLQEAADATGDPRLAERWLLTGGEDHALLACFPAGSAVPEPFTVAGRVVEPDRTAGAARVSCRGRDLTGLSGWDHFG